MMSVTVVKCFQSLQATTQIKVKEMKSNCRWGGKFLEKYSADVIKLFFIFDFKFDLALIGKNEGGKLLTTATAKWFLAEKLFYILTAAVGSFVVVSRLVALFFSFAKRVKFKMN